VKRHFDGAAAHDWISSITAAVRRLLVKSAAARTDVSGSGIRA